jgi:hypothetical protein
MTAAGRLAAIKGRRVTSDSAEGTAGQIIC